MCSHCTYNPARFHTNIDLLNSYMDEYAFPEQIRASLRMYFIHCRYGCHHHRDSPVLFCRLCRGLPCVIAAINAVAQTHCISLTLHVYAALWVCNRSTHREERFKKLLVKMSPELQGIVTSHCYTEYISFVPFFRPDLSQLHGYVRAKAEDEVRIFMTQVPQQNTHARLPVSQLVTLPSAT